MRLKKIFPYILILLIAGLILLPQIYAHAFIYGVDSAFHMNRFYDTAMQIKTNQYSYFQSFFGFQQSGRIVNALYGPLFAYINGLVILLVKTWYRYQILSSFIVLSISGSLMYRLAIKNYVKPIFGIIVAGIYMMSDPVMAWLVGQQFTGWGAAFLPLVLLMGTEMMRKQTVSVVKLAAGMALLLQIHVMTSFMAALALLPFFSVGLYLSTHRLKMFYNLLLSIGLALLLTANVWGGMLELSLGNNLLPVAPGIDVSVTAPRIAGQSQAVAASSTASIGAGSGLNTIGISLPVLLMLLAIIIYLGFNLRTMSKFVWVITFNGILFLWIASNYFPWHQIAQIIPSVDYIQFPSRFLVVSIVLLLLAFGICLSHQNSSLITNLIKICFVVYILLSFNNTSYQELQTGIKAYQSNQVVLSDRNLTVATMSSDKLRSLFNDHDLSKAINAFNKPTPDYLPFFVKIRPDQYWIYHPYHLYKSQILTNLQPKTNKKLDHVKKVVNNNALNITWQNPLKHDWWISVPVVKYANTIVIMNGKRVDVDTSTIGKLFIDSKPGINRAKIVYQSSWWFNALVLIMAVSWGSLFMYFGWILLHKYCKNIKFKDKNL